MSSNDNTQACVDDTRPCVQGCGFYGTAQTGYMCSKCFKDAAGATRASIEASPAPAPTATATTAASAPAATTSTPLAVTTTATASAASASLDQTLSISSSESLSVSASAAPAALSAEAGEAKAVEEAAAAAASGQKKRNRCAACNKKVGLTGIECRCELVFCGLHRYPDQHNCTFDFKAHDRANLQKTVMGGGNFEKIDRL